MDVPGTKCVVKVKVEIHIAQALWVLKHPSRFWFSHSGHFGMFSKEGCFFRFWFHFVGGILCQPGPELPSIRGIHISRILIRGEMCRMTGKQMRRSKTLDYSKPTFQWTAEDASSPVTRIFTKTENFGWIFRCFEQISLKLPSIGNSLQHYKYQSLVIGTAIYKLCCSIGKL